MDKDVVVLCRELLLELPITIVDPRNETPLPGNSILDVTIRNSELPATFFKTLMIAVRSSEVSGTAGIMLIRNQKVPRLGPVSSLAPQSRYAPSRAARGTPLTSFLFSRRNQSQKTSWLFVLLPATVTRILAPRLTRAPRLIVNKLLPVCPWLRSFLRNPPWATPPPSSYTVAVFLPAALSFSPLNGLAPSYIILLTDNLACFLRFSLETVFLFVSGILKCM